MNLFRIFAFVSLTFASATCLGASLKPYTATYDVITHGIRAGVAKFTLEKIGKDRWQFKSHSHTTGLVSLFRSDAITESSIFTVTGKGRFHAHKYSYAHTGHGKDRQKILFDWKHDVAHGTYHGDTKTIDIPEGASDPFLAQLKLSRRVAEDMDAGRFPVVNRNKLDIYHLKVVGKESTSVPAGVFTAVRAERSEPGSSRTTVFWLAPKLNYAPARVEQKKDGDGVFRLELRSITFK
jgi:hypothetical protein